MPLAFVLLAENGYPDPANVIGEAARLGIGLTHEMGEPTMLNFRIDSGGNLIVMHIDAPHPDAATMPVGPTSPEPSTVAAHVGHYVVTVMGHDDTTVHPDVLMGIITASLIRSSTAVGAMLGQGAIFHRADVFAAFVEEAGMEIASEIAVDITAAREGDDRMSFLTHGLDRYDREEFYVTSSVHGQGALEYVMALAKWMLADRDKVLPTGDTVGRTAEEQIIVQRVPSPIEGKPPVIRLDLDMDSPGAAAAPTPKKKRWFRRD